MKNITNENVSLSRQESIRNRLHEAGIKVHVGKKTPKKGEYSGVVGKSKKVLQLKI